MNNYIDNFYTLSGIFFYFNAVHGGPKIQTKYRVLYIFYANNNILKQFIE